MTHPQSAHDCRWVLQTLDLPLADWLDAWDAPWTCHCDLQPRRLWLTDECGTCARWEPRAANDRDERPRTP